MKKNTFLSVAIVVLAGILVLLFMLPIGRNDKTIPVNAPRPSHSDTTSKPDEVSEIKPVETPKIVRVKAAGDNLIHSSIYNQAKARAGGKGYDFSAAYQNVADLIGDADFSMVNQETVIAPIYEPSNYPCFNSPVELQDQMLQLGFTVFNQANNHCIDKGEKGILSALEQWKKHPEALVTGVYKDETDYQNIRTKEVNGISFAFIGMTEMTNGISLPQGSSVVILHTAEEQKIKARVERAKKIADVVIVNVHWGNEYTHTPTDAQKSLAKKMGEWGADLIVGHHPHVIQPIEWLENTDGRKTLVAYSLGNFISAQDKGVRMIGGVLDITFTKETPQSAATITKALMVPIITHYDKSFQNIRLYPLSRYTSDLAARHGVKRNTPEFSMDFINETLHTVIGEDFLEK
ncbi:MAG: CapA family protein [Oscillospiraceae bacterium]